MHVVQNLGNKSQNLGKVSQLIRLMWTPAPRFVAPAARLDNGVGTPVNMIRENLRSIVSSFVALSGANHTNKAKVIRPTSPARIAQSASLSSTGSCI